MTKTKFKKTIGSRKDAFMPTQVEWSQLEQSGRKKLWKLARLSMDLTTLHPLPRSGELTKAENALKTALDELPFRRETFLENLTDHVDSQRLQYIPPLPLKSFKQDINRLVDVVVFVDFCLLRKMALPQKLVEIANGLRIEKGSKPKSRTDRPHVQQSAGLDSSAEINGEDLYLALLGQYIKKLAVEQKAPPKTLITGTGRLNASALATVIEESGVIDERDVSGGKTKNRRLSHSSLRRMLPIALAKASKRHWGLGSVVEGDVNPSEE